MMSRTQVRSVAPHYRLKQDLACHLVARAAPRNPRLSEPLSRNVGFANWRKGKLSVCGRNDTAGTVKDLVRVGRF